MIKDKIGSSSQLFYPSDSGYNATIIHFWTSSIMSSVCSVEPGTAKDVATIVSIGQNFFQQCRNKPRIYMFCFLE